jgi:hypothetical protein
MLTSRQILTSVVGASILMIVIPSFLNHFYNFSKFIADSPIVLTPALLFLYFKLKKTRQEEKPNVEQEVPSVDNSEVHQEESYMSSYISVLKTLHS